MINRKRFPVQDHDGKKEESRQNKPQHGKAQGQKFRECKFYYGKINTPYNGNKDESGIDHDSVDSVLCGVPSIAAFEGRSSVGCGLNCKKIRRASEHIL